MPVRNRSAMTLEADETRRTPALAAAPASAPRNSSTRALRTSERLRTALASVPTTKPAWTAMVSQAASSADMWNSSTSAGVTAVAENHSVMPRNSAIASAASIHHARPVWPRSLFTIGSRTRGRGKAAAASRRLPAGCCGRPAGHHRTACVHRTSAPVHPCIARNVTHPTHPFMDIPYIKRTLANGLDVIVPAHRQLPMVAVNVWYHVGSKNEQPGRTGFAHLFEHLMLEGSQHHDRGYFQPLQQAGGLLNGSTNTDRTNYWEVVPTGALELALWMESDRMGYLLPALTDAKFTNQRDVVLNERRQNYENRPYGLAAMALEAAVVPPDQ